MALKSPLGSEQDSERLCIGAREARDMELAVGTKLTQSEEDYDNIIPNTCLE